MTHAKPRVGMLLIFALLISSCGGGGGGGGSNPPPPPPPPPPGSGLDARPSNTTCLAPDRTTGTLTFATPRFTTLTFSQPVALLQAPGDNSRWFVVEQGGFVRTFQNDQAASSSTVFVNATGVVNSNGSEMGLLGMAFHPDWPTDARVFLAYTAGGSPLVLRIAEWESTDNGLTLPNTPSRTILTINKSNNETNHNGGGLAFSPVDGYLYLGMGDGGGGNDMHGQIGNAQLLTTLQGKMVRIDVDGSTGGAPYAIPPDNPFAASTVLCGDDGSGGQNCPEIYAYGLRNPWRWSFDRQTGQLWLGDVGQGAREEHNRIARGGNYGWRCFEGTRDTNLACGNNPNPLPPVAEYARTEGFSTTGGYVYRGTAIPALVGRYVFADFGSGLIWHIANDTAPTVTVTSAQAFDTSFSISSFGEAHDGELYLLNYASGQIHRLTASTSGGGGGVATQLSDTGCVNASNPAQPASGLIPYAPNAPFWSDGATKERWIGLPNGQNISVGGNGDWGFPNGTVLVKNFRLGQQLVETRLFMRHPDGVWAGYSYEWNSQQTNATLVVGGKQATVGGQTWVFPSSAQCLQCHTEVAGRTLGLETRQLAFSIPYPQTGRTANQLVTLNAINTLSPPIANPASETPYPDPAGTAGTMQERARAYLHTNCAQCHQPGGPAPGNLDLRYSATLPNTNACNAAPTAGDLGIANALIIAPGDANRSVLLARMNRRDANQMPPLASTLVDTGGVTLVRDWINSLTNCN